MLSNGTNLTSVINDFVQICITGSNANSPITTLDNTGLLCERVSNFTDNAIHYNNGQTWVWAQNLTYDCLLTDTEYNVTFNMNGGTQRVDPYYTFKWTDKPAYGNYYAIVNTLANGLTGAMRGYFSGVLTYKTRITETALMGAFQATKNPANLASGYADTSGLSPSMANPQVQSLVRNMTMDALIEELSRNLTLSLFSAEEVRYVHREISSRK
jgi:hypothetical protein